MTAGRRYLQGALGLQLSLDLGEVRIHGVRRLAIAPVAGEPGGLRQVREMRTHFQQAAGRVDRRVLDQGRFVGIRLRKDEGAGFSRALAVHGEGHGQRATHRPQLTRQRQFARELESVQLFAADLARGGQDAERDRQIEAAGLLGKVGGRQVDGDAPRRHVEAGVLQGGAHTVLGFAHFRVGKADDGHGGKTVGQVDFDADGGGFHAGEGAAA